ncbi:MAG: hypothetical protein FP831_11240, partial [Anaerolineae bacterium]|nr:hypothetical protein [Anaerolineae bacterium]
MTFILCIPTKDYLPVEVKTTNDLAEQILEELEYLKFGKNKLFSTNAISSCIKQACIYYRDAKSVNWRSSGLLYYYSFLNLAKAYLGGKKMVTSTELTTTKILHGITADPLQIITNLMDFEIKIYPPTQNNSINTFSKFYESVTKKRWPFTGNILIQIKEIVGFSYEISREFQSLFNISPCVIPVRSMIIDDGRSMWLDLLIPSSYDTVFQSQIINMPLDKKQFLELSHFEKEQWLLSHAQVTKSYLSDYVLKTHEINYTQDNREKVI